MVKMKDLEKVIANKLGIEEDYIENLTPEQIEEISNTKLPPGSFIVHVECGKCGTINSVDLSLVDDHDMHCAECDRCINNDDFTPEAFEYHPRLM
jgi:hypothetical protein